MVISRRTILGAGLVLAGSLSIRANAFRFRTPVTLTYLGNAGWCIDDGSVFIIVDPYVSQFEHKRGTYPNDDGDALAIPNEALISTHIPRADFVVVTHSHLDHMLDAPTLAKRTGAVIIGSASSANLARAYAVPEKQLIIVDGGEDLDFGRFSLKVIPSLHSELLAKHYNNHPEYVGSAPAGLTAPLHESAFHEGGTFSYLLRISGHQILIMGAMNYIEREMEGLRPDIALVGSGLSRKEIYDCAGRLMRALGHPAVVLPTRWDSYNTTSEDKARQEASMFASEIRIASPRTKVIIPGYFSPIVLR